MIFVGDDWAEDHHDVHVMDEAGSRLVVRRLPEGLPGIRALHELLAGYADEPGAVVIGIETDRGLWVEALLAAGYQLYAVNPLAVARYRDRHQVSGAKSDTSDAKVLADLPVRWCAPTGTTTARSPQTPPPPKRSKCWPVGTRT